MALHDTLVSQISTDPDLDFGIAVHHIESGEDLLVNADALYPTAGIFKVPVMVEVFRQARAGRFELNDSMTLKAADKTLTSGVLPHLQDGLRLSIRDLIMLMIIVSDNTATTMLLNLVGCDNVTTGMHALGLSSIHVVMNVHEMFLHAFGLAEADQLAVSLATLTDQALRVPMDYGSRAFSRGPDNNVSSAGDMTRLMTLIYEGKVLDRPTCDEMLAILSNQQYSYRVPRYLPWRRVFNKTGTLRGLRNDSGIIYCARDSHAAYSVFSFDRVPLSPNDPRMEAQRDLRVDQIMGEMGLAIFEHYGGKFSPMRGF